MTPNQIAQDQAQIGQIEAIPANKDICPKSGSDLEKQGFRPTLRQPVAYGPDMRGQIMLSERERLIAEFWARTQNYAECVRALRAKYPKCKTTDMSVRQWLQRPHVQAFLLDRMSDLGVFNGWTKEKWVRVCSEKALRPTRTDGVSALFLKLLGQHYGWTGEQHTTFNAAGDIQVYQADGSKL